MGKKRAERQEQPTIWEIPDDVWPLKVFQSCGSRVRWLARTHTG